MAESDQSQRLALQVPARIAGLSVPDSLAYQAVLESDLPHDRQKKPDRMIGNAVVERFRRVGDDDAARGRGLDRDIIGAASGPNDGAAALQVGNALGRHNGAAAQHPHDVGVTRAGSQLRPRLTLLKNKLNVVLRHRLGDPRRQLIRIHVDHGNFKSGHLVSNSLCR